MLSFLLLLPPAENKSVSLHGIWIPTIASRIKTKRTKSWNGIQKTYHSFACFTGQGCEVDTWTLSAHSKQYQRTQNNGHKNTSVLYLSTLKICFHHFNCQPSAFNLDLRSLNVYSSPPFFWQCWNVWELVLSIVLGSCLHELMNLTKGDTGEENTMRTTRRKKSKNLSHTCFTSEEARERLVIQADFNKRISRNIECANARLYDVQRNLSFFLISFRTTHLVYGLRNIQICFHQGKQSSSLQTSGKANILGFHPWITWFPCHI